MAQMFANRRTYELCARRLIEINAGEKYIFLGNVLVAASVKQSN
jgi:hypothetical protein